MKEAMAAGRGFVFVTGHVGNWELLARRIARAGIPPVVIARRAWDEKVDALIASFRASGGDPTQLRQPVYFVASVVSPRQLRLVCKFTTSPPSTALRSEVAKIPSFSDFEQVTRDIMGEGGDCGKMNAPARAMNDLREGLDALIVRPWAYSTDLESYGFPVWGYSGAWNYRKYSEFKTILPKTRQALADRYARNYRLPKSEALKLADAAITAALARGFSHGAAEDEYHELHRALLEGRWE